MTDNKILKLEFSARSEAAGKLTEQQSECLDHEIQTNPQTTESYEIQWNLVCGSHTSYPAKGPYLDWHNRPVRT